MAIRLAFPFLVSVLAAAQLAPAGAQAPQVLEFLQRVNRDTPAPDAAQVAAAIAAMRQRLRERDPSGCAWDVTVTGAPQPATADRMIFNAAASGEARNGWTVRGALSGCRTGTQRFVLALMSDGRLIALPANQGETLTTSSQFRDTIQQVLAALLTVPALREGACATASPGPIVTEVTSRGSDLGPDVFGGRYVGSWTETGTVHTCGRRVAVPISFTADGDGGVYTRIAADKVHLLD